MQYSNYLPYYCNPKHTGYISLKFGVRGHTGVDSYTVAGSIWDVCAVCNATVTKVYYSSLVGNVVEYAYGNVRIAYYHLSKVYVKVGTSVKLGTKIGVMGKTGSLATGVHLHVSMWINNVLVNPEPYMAGTKSMPVNTNGGSGMVRKGIRADLNLRKGVGTGYGTYGFIPNGTLLNILQTSKASNGSTWGKVTCKMSDGKEYTGWCNIGNTWSSLYTGALNLTTISNVSEIANLKTQVAKLQARNTTLSNIVAAVKKAVG